MNYQNGKIYRIDCLTTGKIYIGSTCQPTAAKRLAKHVSGFKTWKKTVKGFVTSYPIIERDNCNISIIENETKKMEEKLELVKKMMELEREKRTSLQNAVKGAA